MSKFYELLKAKANDPETRDKIVYVENFNSDYMKHEFVTFTYNDFYNLVNLYIERFRKQKKKYPKVTTVLVNQSVASIAATIALLKLGISPVLIDIKEYSREEHDLPYVYKLEKANIKYNDITSERYLKFLQNLPENISFSKESPKIFIYTSGSLKKKIHSISEDNLINSSLQYGDNNSIFYSYISCANISGILTNLVNPLLHNSQVILYNSFNLSPLSALYKDCWVDENSQNITYTKYLFSTRSTYILRRIIVDEIGADNTYVDGNNLVTESVFHSNFRLLDNKFLTATGLYNNRSTIPNLTADSVMLPRDILVYLEKGDFTELDLSNLKHIYLAGGTNTQDIIDFIRAKIPSIKPGAFVNLYGATEAGGVISTCTEDKLRICYINAQNYAQGEIIYTFDKTNFYKIMNGSSKPIKVKRTFSEFDFIEYIPVSERVQDNINVDSNLNITFKDCDGKYISAGDLGIYIDNQLYVLGRKSLLINLNGKSYFLDALERYFSKKIGTKVYCILNERGNRIQICVEGGENLDNFSLYSRAMNFSLDFKELALDFPVIEYSEKCKSKISGKVSRAALKAHSYKALEQCKLFKEIDSQKKLAIDKIVEEFNKYDGCIVTPDYEKCQIRVKLKNRYLFPREMLKVLEVSPILIDDENGEYVFEVNGNFVFENVKTNQWLLSFFKFSGSFYDEWGHADDLDELRVMLLHDGLKKDIADELAKYDNFALAYKPIDKKGPMEIILKQILINAVSKLLEEMTYDEAIVFLNTVKEKRETLEKSKEPKDLTIYSRW